MRMFKRNQKWYVEFNDHLERVRRLALYPDKMASRSFAEKVVRLCMFRQAGEVPDTQLNLWLEQLPRKMLDKLVKIGIVDKRRVAAGMPLLDHLDDYEKVLTANGRSEKHISHVIYRAKRVITECKFYFWPDVASSKVQQYLSKLHDNGRGLSAQTVSFYAQSFKQFCRWMYFDGRASECPVANYSIGRVNDKTRHRRALTVDEISRLLELTEKSKEIVYGVFGVERSLIYRLALETGLRANEIKNLKISDFDFNNKVPTVTVQAMYSKRRQTDVLPLRLETVLMLKDKLDFTCKLPMVDAFNTPHVSNFCKMYAYDRKNAHISYKDNTGGVSDFHGLRHTFITMMAKSGIHPKMAQTLARHSDINLTMNRYTHIMLEDQVTALNKLPSYSTDKSDIKIA
jgi:integrase